MEFRQSSKLSEVCYEIRGPVIEHANALEEAGHSVLRLNTGNPALFGFEAPEEILQDMIRMLPRAHGYTDSRGVLSARRAVAQRYQTLGLEVDVDDVFLGNGVSELVSMAVQALIEDGDEILIPAPDFPLWTAVTTLAGGKAVHYLCDEQAEWYPDLADMELKITDRTKAVVIINPNNPTGAVYPKEIVEGILDLARRHGLMVFADEIYDQILYDDAVHHSAAALAPDLVVLTFCGLSKTYRVAGFRSGWLVVSGPKQHAKDYLEGLTMLASNLRPCANVPAQYAIQAALGGRQSIADLTAPGGRLREQRDVAWEKLNEIPWRVLREAQGRALRLPPPRPQGPSDPRRREVRPRPAAAREDPGRPGHRLQLARPRPLPHPHAPARGRPGGGDRPDRAVPERIPAIAGPCSRSGRDGGVRASAGLPRILRSFPGPSPGTWEPWRGPGGGTDAALSVRGR
ncbi:Histidinol-phosphate aminotransferase [Streptomyces glaucescens]